MDFDIFTLILCRVGQGRSLEIEKRNETEVEKVKVVYHPTAYPLPHRLSLKYFSLWITIH